MLLAFHLKGSPAGTPTPVGPTLTLEGVELLLAKSGLPLAMYDGYLDAGTPYTASITTNLFDVIPKGNPSQYGIMDHIALETGSVTAETVQFLTDEAPGTASYHTASQSIDAPHRAQGTNLLETWYQTISDLNNRGARRVSLKVNFAAASTSFNVYSIVVAYKPVD